MARNNCQEFVYNPSSHLFFDPELDSQSIDEGEEGEGSSSCHQCHKEKGGHRGKGEKLVLPRLYLALKNRDKGHVGGKAGVGPPLPRAGTSKLEINTSCLCFISFKGVLKIEFRYDDREEENELYKEKIEYWVASARRLLPILEISMTRYSWLKKHVFWL